MVDSNWSTDVVANGGHSVIVREFGCDRGRGRKRGEKERRTRRTRRTRTFFRIVHRRTLF